MVFFLAGFHLYVYLLHDVILPPMGLSTIVLLSIGSYSQWRWARVALEIYGRGLISIRKLRRPYVPWEAIDHCKWSISKNCLEIFADPLPIAIPIRNIDAERALATIGRFVEVRGERGETIHAGLPKPSPEEVERIKRKVKEDCNPFQFSILSLLMLTVVVAAASGWYAVAHEYNRLQQKSLDALNDWAPYSNRNASGAVQTLWFTPPLSTCPRKMTDKDVKLLKPFHRLKSLDLSHSDITDAAIPDLESLPSLTFLMIYGTKITPEGFERLKREMPNTEINH